MRKSKYIVHNGECLNETPERGVYVFQNIHTLNYLARHTREHLDIANLASRKLFDTEISLSAKELEQQIKALLDINRISRRSTTLVRLSIDSVGDYFLECGEASVYEGYALRSLMPEAIYLPIGVPLATYPTSAGAETRATADAIARTKGYHTAILMGESGNIALEHSEPIVIVKGGSITLPQSAIESVELRLVEQAALRLGMEIRHKVLFASDLDQAEEVLRISYQGITAMKSIEKRQYMHIAAERLAREFASIELTLNNERRL